LYVGRAYLGNKGDAAMQEQESMTNTATYERYVTPLDHALQQVQDLIRQTEAQYMLALAQQLRVVEQDIMEAQEREETEMVSIDEVQERLEMDEER
jgi:hypothetical protein